MMAEDEEVLDELLSQEPNESYSRPNVALTASTPYPKAKPAEPESSVSKESHIITGHRSVLDIFIMSLALSRFS